MKLNFHLLLKLISAMAFSFSMTFGFQSKRPNRIYTAMVDDRSKAIISEENYFRANGVDSLRVSWVNSQISKRQYLGYFDASGNFYRNEYVDSSGKVLEYFNYNWITEDSISVSTIEDSVAGVGSFKLFGKCPNQKYYVFCGDSISAIIMPNAKKYTGSFKFDQEGNPIREIRYNYAGNTIRTDTISYTYTYTNGLISKVFEKTQGRYTDSLYSFYDYSGLNSKVLAKVLAHPKTQNPLFQYDITGKVRREFKPSNIRSK